MKPYVVALSEPYDKRSLRAKFNFRSVRKPLLVSFGAIVAATLVGLFFDEVLHLPYVMEAQRLTLADVPVLAVTFIAATTIMGILRQVWDDRYNQTSTNYDSFLRNVALPALRSIPKFRNAEWHFLMNISSQGKASWSSRISETEFELFECVLLKDKLVVVTSVIPDEGAAFRAEQRALSLAK